MSKPLQDLMQKEMNRKEFLMTLGFGAAALFGLTQVLHLLGKTDESGKISASSVDQGYGSTSFGSNKEK